MSIEIKIKNSTIVIPNWMNSLSQQEVNQLLVENNSNLVFSCGTSPKDGLVSLITTDLNVYSFDPNDHCVPIGEFFPTPNSL